MTGHTCGGSGSEAFFTGHAAQVATLATDDDEALLALSTMDAAGAARRAGSTPVGRAIRSHVDAEAGLSNQALRHAREALDAVGPHTAPISHLFVRLTLVRRLGERGEYDEALTILDTADGPAGSGDERVWCAAARADLLIRQGRLGEARRLVEKARREGPALLLPMLDALAVRIAQRAGDLMAAAALIPDRQGLSGLRYWVGRFDWYAVVQAAEEDGARAASALVNGSGPDLPDDMGLVLDEPVAPALLARVALAVDDGVLALRAVTTAERAADAGAPAACAAHVRGVVFSDPVALAETVRRHPDPWAAARAAEDLAEITGGDGEVGHLDDALRRFDRIGATRDASRVRRRLRLLGVRRGIRSNPAVADDGWTSLSVTERTIAHLAGNALTNQQIATRVFLSPHTVNYHLRRIYRKLGISSRVQLARITRGGPADRPW